MSKTAELKSAGTRFVMNSVVWNANAKLAQVVYTALANIEKSGGVLSAQSAASRACDSPLMQRAVALLIEDDPQYAKNCAKAELAWLLSDASIDNLVSGEFRTSLALVFADALEEANVITFQHHPGYRIVQFEFHEYNQAAGNLHFEAVLKGRGNSKCYQIVGYAHPMITFDHEGNPSLDWQIASHAKGEKPASRVGTRVVSDDYIGFVLV